MLPAVGRQRSTRTAARLMMPDASRTGRQAACASTTDLTAEAGPSSCLESRMNWLSLLSVLVGGAVGSAVRWLLGLALNPVLPALPLGTLTVNLVGGFIIGGAIGIFDQFQSLPPELRLFI